MADVESHPMLMTRCVEMLKMMYKNDDHIRVRYLDQNAGESAVQSMDDESLSLDWCSISNI